MRVTQRLIRLYQLLISPWFGSRCRFVPTCSEYTHQAIQGHGLLRGSWLGCKRICKCHPWGDEGFDPVPTNPKKKQQPVA